MVSIVQMMRDLIGDNNSVCVDKTDALKEFYVNLAPEEMEIVDNVCLILTGYTLMELGVIEHEENAMPSLFVPFKKYHK